MSAGTGYSTCNSCLRVYQSYALVSHKCVVMREKKENYLYYDRVNMEGICDDGPLEMQLDLSTLFTLEIKRDCLYPVQSFLPLHIHIEAVT